MLKGKLIDDNGKVRFEGELTASDYALIHNGEKHQLVPVSVGAGQIISPDIILGTPSKESLPITPEIKLFLAGIPPKERVMSVVSKHFFGKLLSAKNRSIYSLVYERFKRAKRNLEREEKAGVKIIG